MTVYEELAANPPSSIALHIPPLMGVFEHPSVGMAAALLVIACRHHGDRWQALRWEQLEQAIQHVIDARLQPAYAIVRGRMLAPPEFDRLVELGHAAWHGQPGAGALELAPSAIQKMARFFGRKAHV